MSSLISKILFGNKEEEITQIKTGVDVQRKKSLNELKLINRGLRNIINAGEVELVVKNIHKISLGK